MRMRMFAGQSPNLSPLAMTTFSAKASVMRREAEVTAAGPEAAAGGAGVGCAGFGLTVTCAVLPFPSLSAVTLTVTADFPGAWPGDLFPAATQLFSLTPPTGLPHPR